MSELCTWDCVAPRRTSVRAHVGATQDHAKCAIGPQTRYTKQATLTRLAPQHAHRRICKTLRRPRSSNGRRYPLLLHERPWTADGGTQPTSEPSVTQTIRTRHTHSSLRYKIAPHRAGHAKSTRHSHPNLTPVCRPRHVQAPRSHRHRHH